MIHKFHPDKNRWDGVEPHIYKENPGVFREVTKQILFDNENDLPVQFRYFQVEKNGFSSLEHHKHMHAVMIFKGKGHVLLGNQVYAVEEGDFLTIAPLAVAPAQGGPRRNPWFPLSCQPRQGHPEVSDRRGSGGNQEEPGGGRFL